MNSTTSNSNHFGIWQFVTLTLLYNHFQIIFYPVLFQWPSKIIWIQGIHMLETNYRKHSSTGLLLVRCYKIKETSKKFTLPENQTQMFKMDNSDPIWKLHYWTIGHTLTIPIPVVYGLNMPGRSLFLYFCALLIM